MRALPLLAAAVCCLLTGTPSQAQTFVGVRSGYYALAQGGQIEQLFQGYVDSSKFNAGTAGLQAVHYFSPNLAADAASVSRSGRLPWSRR